MQQFWTEELSSLMARLKLSMATADIGVARVHPLDIELVMSQAGVPMDKAAKALKESDGNVITAIRELTN
jgi:NACalpha-BTF3-like transcription factor